MVQLTEEKMAHIKELRKKAMKLPLHPGVYIMHSRDDTIIYIGKAKALKNRVSQYFGSDKNHNEKVRRMVSNVEYFEYILTDSEFEALILESSLIKQHQPKYNILLKDDKGYSYIKVTAGDWPRISETKQVLNDGAKYIGPYLSAWTIKDTVEEARKIFRLPSCTRKFPQEIGRGRPCLNYYIKQCCAPCRGHVSQKEYNEAVQEALDFIRGGTSDSVRTLTEKMNEAAENLDFELAARIRDRITAINKLKERQKVVASRVPEQDVIALVLGGEKVSIQVFRFAGGRLYDRESFLLNADDEPEQIRSEFVMQYYSMRDKIPPVITIDGPVNDDGVLEEWLTKKAERRVKFHIPQKGEQKQLVEMCRTNAAEALAQAMGRATGRETSALDELRQLLNLPKTPEYIESYDISNLAGGENVAGMIVFENGRPLKSAYRKFKIKTVVGQDDYGSMREVIRRAGQDSTVLLSSHLLSEVTNVCGRAIVLDEGVIRYDGTMDALLRGAASLRLMYRGDAPMMALIRELPGVTEVTEQDCREDGCHLLLIRHEMDDDLRAQVSALCYENHCALLEETNGSDALEDAFLHVIARKDISRKEVE